MTKVERAALYAEAFSLLAQMEKALLASRARHERSVKDNPCYRIQVSQDGKNLESVSLA
jgi:hypothetical protein